MLVALLFAAALFLLAHAASEAGEVTMFTTGWDGPVDAGDNWRMWETSGWDRISTVVSVGAIPTELVQVAHDHGVKVGY